MSQMIFAPKGKHLTTPIPDTFIFDYLPKASGIFCKVYIYTYSLYYHERENLSTADIAAALNLTEPDLFEAYSELARAGLLQFRRTKDSCQLSFPLNPAPTSGPGGKTLSEEASANASKSSVPVSCSDTASTPTAQVATKIVRYSIESRPTYSAEELSFVSRNEQVSALFTKAATFLGGTVSPANMSLLYSFYDYYRMPIDEISVLMDYLSEKGKNSLRYMESVVIDWLSKDINTAERAKTYVENEKRYLPILKAMNRPNQTPSAKEKEMLENWLDNLSMPVDLICEAAKRTLVRIDPASFNYMDSCIKNWNSLGYNTLEAVLNYDPDRRQQFNQSKVSSLNNMINSGEDYESAALAWENR